jgi:hypothetical protein
MLRRSLRRRGLDAAATPAQAYSAGLVLGDDPTSYSVAMESSDWQRAIKEEFCSLIENETWDYADRVPDKKSIGCKWVFKTKSNADGTLRYKARLVIKGYEQTEFGETYAPVARLASLHTLLSMSAISDWQVHQMDVVTAFLNPKIEEEVFMDLPEGLDWLDRETFKQLKGGVCRLRKALYGLKQAPRLWFKDIDAFLRSIGFTPDDMEENLYYSESKLLALLLYVDDMLIASALDHEILAVKTLLQKRYKMSDMGLAQQFLGIDIRQSPGQVEIRQHRFIKSVLQRFGMQDCNGTWTPMDARPPAEFTPLDSESQHLYQSLIGSIMYIMLGTRPDLAFTVSALSKFSASAGQIHLTLAKRVLRYLHKTIDMGITYSRTGSDIQQLQPTSNASLVGYTDSDWAGDTSDRKSTGGFVFLLAGGAISWRSKKQTIVALSTTEAEYIAASEASREALWLQGLIGNLTRLTTTSFQVVPTTIYTDSTGCLAQVQNARHHDRTKHVDIKYHHVRDLVERHLIQFQQCSTHEMVADVLTKPLGRTLHWQHLPRMGLHSKTSKPKLLELGN